MRNHELYLREMTRIYEEQTILNRRIEKLAAAIRNDRPLPGSHPPLDIHKLAEAICMSPRA